MIKKSVIIFIAIMVGYFFIVKRVTVDSGVEAVIIKKPWFFGKKGIEPKVVSTGTIWSVASTEIKLIPLKPFKIEDSFKNIFTRDNIPIDFNITFVFKYQKGKGAILVENFGADKEWYKSLLSEPIHNTMELKIRDVTFDDIYYNHAIVSELRKDVIFGVEDIIKKRGIPIDLIDVTIGKLTPPKEIIKNAIQEEVEKQKIEFHKLRKKVEEASAEADKAYMLKMNMTPKEYIKIKEIELNNKKLANQKYAIDHAKDSNGTIKIIIDMGK